MLQTSDGPGDDCARRVDSGTPENPGRCPGSPADPRAGAGSHPYLVIGATMGHPKGKTPSLADRISAGVKVGVHQEGSAVLDRIARLDSPVVQGATSRPERSLSNGPQHRGPPPRTFAAEARVSGPEAWEGSPVFVGGATATGYKPGSILEFSLDLLDDNPCNPRRFYLQESIDRLA